MKELFITAAFVSFQMLQGFSQYLSTSGGTLTGALTINGSSANTARVYVTGTDPNGTAVYLNSSSTNGRSWGLLSNGVAGQGEFTLYDGTAGLSRMTINSSGNIGIGTPTPATQLHVVDGVSPTITIESNTNSNAYLTLKGGGTGSLPYRIFSTGSGSYLGAGKFTISDENTGYEAFVINAGNIGIGTTDPQGYKLAVNGNMIAESVKVKLHSNWPDHVFAKNYFLKPLSEVEKFVYANQHLPEIPSTKEVEANGINLGEMNAKLLQKIEELTLYVIEQNKRIEKLENKKEINHKY